MDTSKGAQPAPSGSGAAGEATPERTQVTYVGRRLANLSVEVVVVEPDGREHPLPHIRRHSEGFEWGYGGSGPADLAFSILAHACDQTTAFALYQQFKGEVVAHLPRDPRPDLHRDMRLGAECWRLTLPEIQAWVRGERDAAEPENDNRWRSARRERLL
jgi:hypothetical protein